VEETNGAPLSDIRVVDLATYVAGPWSTMIFADLGADVIKVEPPRGDPARRFGRIGRASPLFVNCNRGKKSVCLDLKQTEGRERLHDLLSGADVMVANWRDEVAARLALDDPSLEDRHPHLIRAYITGYGQGGPLAGAPAFDGVLQARLGITATQGKDAPAMVRSYFVDKVAALFVAQAVLAALLVKRRAGHGERVDVSMLDAGAYFNFPDVMMNRTFVKGGDPSSPRNAQLDAVRPIRARNGWLVVSPVSGQQIRAACGALDRPNLADELFATSDAAETVTAMYSAFEDVTRSLTVEECVERFMSAGVPAGPCNDLDGHLDDVQVAHNEIYETHDTESFGLVRQVRYPALFGSYGHLGFGAEIPELDEHGRQVRGAWNPEIGARST
jgi:CoA:oxalate CoA-transferase